MPPEIAAALMTGRELATYLHVHTKTLERWRRVSNPLPCVRVRSRVRYDLRDVLAWLAASERGKGA